MVQILIESELCSVTKEFSPDINLKELCEKIYTITGVEPQDMELHIKDVSDDVNIIKNPLATPQLTIVNETIDKISVEDTNTKSITNQLKNEDESSSIGFQLSEEVYARKSDTVLRWKQENKFGKFDPDYLKKMEQDQKLQNEKVKSLTVDARCSVKVPGQPERRGWLRFIGKIPEINKDDTWCGVEFDEPMGKNNGTFKSHVYFGPVKDKYGGFIKPIHVETSERFTPFELDFETSDEEI
ncbi:hypothetical protein NCAS_0B07100 [Naumovozyma castellii]|uniref:CAP-Gly domain-containing protein n=1 Tax=Naumovozyma castellii TaxID=27288 RepID=G0VA64_NAUCA|nr:hypothetical protein NCAS_0B07100 [Naumovozyma castellii CBS 4309]CCC68794.1 hypothetical protein NCAS_0B07100 [Naumovozyma castellii CBS 4309]